MDTIERQDSRGLVEIAGSYTLIMREQPQAFARAIREFVRETAEAAAAG